MSGADLIAATAARLMAGGVPDARSDARRLVAHALGVEPGAVHLWQGVPDADQVAILDSAVAARLARQPVSQIVGWRDFWKHRFDVTRDTLDPRPETETLVAIALTLPWGSVLDLGTGTGAIVISLLAERPGAVGMGVDLSRAALAVARQNAARIGVSPTFVRSDWFGAVEGRFDLIVSNPPYIAAAEMPLLSVDVREWEPRLALTDEGDGLGAYRSIAAKAPAHLTPGGWLAVEIGPTQAEAVAAIFQSAGLSHITARPDMDGRDRVVLGRIAG